MLWRRVVRRITCAPSRCSTLSTCLAIIVGDSRRSRAAAAKLPSSATRTTTFMLSSRSIFHTMGVECFHHEPVVHPAPRAQGEAMTLRLLLVACAALATQTAAAQPAPPELRLYVLDCGH